MGKYINTKYADSHESIMGLAEDLVKNPLYPFNSKKGIRVTWFNSNTEKSTLDSGSLLAYSQTGNNSPIRFNQINGVYLYQFPKIEFDFEDDEFGMHNVPIEGESFILPNTFVPLDGDFFIVEHIKDSRWLFKVNKVQMDTFENGSNGYKVSWILDQTTDKSVVENVPDDAVYEYIDVEEGTNLKAVVKKTNYIKAKDLDEVSVTVCKYFFEIFYNHQVQTFIWHWLNGSRIYDPFVIEFMKRNKLMDPIRDTVYVTHMTELENTFTLDYMRSVYRAFELRDKNTLARSERHSSAEYISDPGTIFYSMFDNYYAMTYDVVIQENEYGSNNLIEVLGDDLYDHIMNNTKYGDDNMRFLNIIISYFNNEPIMYPNIISDLEMLPAATNHALTVEQTFYYILFVIFCIDNEIKNLLS